jgi:hypothetical protein
MADSSNMTRTSLLTRFLKHAWVRMLLFALVCAIGTVLLTSGMHNKVSSKQTDFLADAVRRSAVQCYALEGRFPDNLAYLENNYGLIIDHNNYLVYYEQMGGNLIPQIRVNTLTH